jgi:hypothetical protein
MPFNYKVSDDSILQLPCVNSNINLVKNDKGNIDIDLTVDTEYEQGISMSVECIQIKINDNNLVYLKDDLDVDFNPCINSLKDLNVDVKICEYVDDIVSEAYELWLNLTRECKLKKEFKSVFKTSLNTNYWDNFLNKYKIHSSCLQCVDDKEDIVSILIKLPKINYTLLTFFSDVDIFKIFGKNHQSIFLDARLVARRVIKPDIGYIAHPVVTINGVPYEVQIKLSDCSKRLPLQSGNSLDAQNIGLKTGIEKIDLDVNPKIKKLTKKLKIPSIKQKMSSLRNYGFIDELIKYGARDLVATEALSIKQQELYDCMNVDLALPKKPIKDTTGSNVSDILKDIYKRHFYEDSEDKEYIEIFNSQGDKSTKTELLNYQSRLAHIDKLQKVQSNNFGTQTFRTVGGLLYSRVAKYPYLKGIFKDLDMSSCYGTRLTDLNVYLGQPVITTFRNEKDRPKLKDVIEFLLNNSPDDGWFIRVSGKLQEAINTIILSDLRFDRKERVTFKTIFDINPNRKSINKWNAYKVSSEDAQSTLLTKEIKFGLITYDTLQILKLMPDEWYQEYLDLFVDCLVFIPNEMICNDFDEFNSKLKKYPVEDDVEIFKDNTGLKDVKPQYCQKNLVLKLPISSYVKDLISKRKEYKKQGNVIQEVYKLVINSIYGALACEFLPVNNFIASNIITSSCRSTAWLMMNACNGFQVITDGCQFTTQNFPIGKKFKHILKNNPNYLRHFDPEIKSDLEIDQSWIDTNFTKHLRDFYDVDDNTCKPIERFNFELKNEIFKVGNKEIKCDFFTEYFNTGSGNYAKGYEGVYKLKARSFDSRDLKLTEWYISSLKDGYISPYIYGECEIIKFAMGNIIAISMFNHDENLAELAHPMGFSRELFKFMRLITRSQFLFNTELQLKNFENTNQNKKLGEISKSFLDKYYWLNVELEDLARYGVTELNENIDYCKYSKNHAAAIGFEIMALSSTHKNSIQSVRIAIVDKIDCGKNDFNACLQINRFIPQAKKFANLFASLIVQKANSEYKLKRCLQASCNVPTVMTVNRDSIKVLKELLERPDNEYN